MLIQQLNEGEKPPLYYFNTSKYELGKLRKMIKTKLDSVHSNEANIRKKINKRIMEAFKREKLENQKRIKKLRGNTKKLQKIIKVCEKKPSQSPTKEMLGEITTLKESIVPNEKFFDYRVALR